MARCWAGVWATLNSIDPAVPPGPAALEILRRLTWNRSQGRHPRERWLSTIADPLLHHPVRDEIRDLVAATLAPAIPAPAILEPTTLEPGGVAS